MAYNQVLTKYVYENVMAFLKSQIVVIKVISLA